MGTGQSRFPFKEYKKPNFEEVEKIATKSGFYSGLNGKMGDLLSNYNNRDIEQIQKHLDAIKKKLESEIEGKGLDLLFGGSIAKHTYVDGLSDLDMLVKLNRSDLAKLRPEEVLKYFKEKLEERFPKSEVKMGDLAVSVLFKSTGLEIQLLPSVKTATGFRIADPETKNWSKVIKPFKFANELTEVNQNNNKNVVPIIKLFKPINEKAPQDIKMSGYHTEALAIDIFKDYSGEKTYSKMLTYFCQKAQKRVLKPIGEITGQSEYIDSKFGTANSILRKKLSSYLERITMKMKLATSNSSIDDWRQILE